MSSSRRVPLAVAILLAWAAPVLAGEGERVDFAAAQQMAAERGVPVVIDFFTDWCIYCKHFDRDLADASTGVAAALERVVFTSIDAEKGEGVELAKRYSVTGFPTYVMIDAQGELIDKWAGYGGPEHFLTAFEGALEDPRSLVAKRAAFEAEPTAALARKLGDVASSSGENEAAIDFYLQAQQLDADLDLRAEILYAQFGKFRRQSEGYDLDAFAADARAAALTGDAPTDLVLTAWQMVGAAARRAPQSDVELPFLEAALAVVENDPEAVDAKLRSAIEIAGYLRVRNTPEKAVEAKKATMPEGWQDDADQLNSFAWWCFENRVNLEEAEQLARRGIEVARPGKQKAMVADTAAEICNALGNCRDAVSLIELAIAEDPENAHYQEQLERFEKLLAGTN